ncbi:MAG: hypothetical protein IPP71_18410 [Bacteroidetes bacterium]|nr:hypothetical protein [Bacteroidota bacterium]
MAKSDAITGLEEPERSSSNQLLIYPAFNAGKCNITVPEEFVNESYLELIIFDNAGKTIQKKILEMNDGTIKVELEAQARVFIVLLWGMGKRCLLGRW